MEKDLALMVGTTSRSLATFIKQELDSTNIAVHLLMEPGDFFKKVKSRHPDIILLDVDYPTKEEAAELVSKLQQKSILPHTPLILIKPFFDELEKELGKIPPENVLAQPFTREDLLTILQKISPREIISSLQQEVEPMTPMKDNVQVTNDDEAIIELTEVVEEGLPLEQLPPIEPDEPLADQEFTLSAEKNADDDSTRLQQNEEENKFPSDEAIDELELLETNSTTGEPPQEEFDHPDSLDKDIIQPETSTGNQAESSFSKSFSAAAVEQVKPEISAGTAANLEKITPDNKDVTAENLTEIAPSVAEEPTVTTHTTDQAGALQPPKETSAAAAMASATNESLNDYLLPEDKTAETNPQAEEAEKSTITDNVQTTTSANRQPPVVTEPAETPFADQVEQLTREWSQKMLASTFASMDKLIQALGEMAPTIVEQVAKEIIPPLAEKIIKAEIKRLEEKIEKEENQ